MVHQVTESSHAVFLSYASEDAQFAERICEVLLGAGIEVWFDRSELRGGDAWDQTIRRKIHDCALFVPVISARSEMRLEGYFRREWKLAADRTRDMADEKAFLVPVVIDDTSERHASVPDKFREVQWTHIPRGEATPAFVEHVSRLLSPETVSLTTENRSPVSAALLQAPPIPATTRATRYLRLLIALVVMCGLGYFAVLKFATSKRLTASTASLALSDHSRQRSQSTTLEKSIAVLPFVDLSEKQDQEYFADGMAEEILDSLANIPGLRLIGRTSSFQFKGRGQDLREVGRALGASYVVEGSVRKSGERVRVTAQLINAVDGSHLWSNTYDEPVGDTINLQQQIASGLSRALQVTVGADIELSSFRNTQAHDLYLRGRHAYDRFDKAGLETAETYLQQALELEPGSIAAAETLALVHEDLAEFGYVAPKEGFERARQSAQRALRLDPKSSLALAVLASVHLIYDWDWAAAEHDAKEAVRLKPRGHTANGILGEVYAALGRWHDSARQFETALTLDPLFPAWHQWLGVIRFVTGRLDDAEAETRKTLEISPTFVGAHYSLGIVLLTRGKPEGALAEMQQEQTDGGRSAGLAIVYHALGRDAESDSAMGKAVAELSADYPLSIADAYAYRGDANQAFRWLERAYGQKDSALFAIKSDPLLKGLASDPRYAAFLRKMNLPL